MLGYSIGLLAWCLHEEHVNIVTHVIGHCHGHRQGRNVSARMLAGWRRRSTPQAVVIRCCGLHERPAVDGFEWNIYEHSGGELNSLLTVALWYSRRLLFANETQDKSLWLAR